jgi:hypothetical protein
LTFRPQANTLVVVASGHGGIFFRRSVMAHKEFESVSEMLTHLSEMSEILESPVGAPTGLGPQKTLCLVRAVEFLGKEVQVLRQELTDVKNKLSLT